MATLKDWYDNAETLEVEALERYRQALETLRLWPLFFAEFKWTSIFTLTAILEFEQQRRYKRFRTSDGYRLFLVDGQWVDSLEPLQVDLRFDNVSSGRDWPLHNDGSAVSGQPEF
jgi:hypothetical protein